MMKRSRRMNEDTIESNKRPRTTVASLGVDEPRKVATQKAAAAVDKDPPLGTLLKAVEDCNKNLNSEVGKSVVYWMRMGDLRTSDNRALSQASKKAAQSKIPLLTLFVLSPQDYAAHDRSPRRIDFTLRNLEILKASLANLNIPLYVTTVQERQRIPAEVLSFAEKYNARNLYANIEYEVDELRRDIRICTLAKQQRVSAHFIHDKCIIGPGTVVTNDGRAYLVYSPYQRKWLSLLNDNLSVHLGGSSEPSANEDSVHKASNFKALFECEVPNHVPNFELEDGDQQTMITVWPAGEKAAKEILMSFLRSKAQTSRLGAINPIDAKPQDSVKDSRCFRYGTDRDRADMDTSSRLSPYLAAGVISVRSCIREVMSLTKAKKVDGGGNTGPGRWVQELAWRDFYVNVLAAFPRVSMGRCFLEKFEDVVWEDNDNDLQKWKDGQTGVPIVDAAMRCLNQMGWMHNRMRMITAMFLVKDLMIDWRKGERYFMERLIDGDLASNNGGWQWCASTGVDACPYFRIFNPYTQSQKVDPNGDFIRQFVPELKKLKGKDIHNPSSESARALGYPLPLVKHNEARDRALERYKSVK